MVPGAGLHHVRVVEVGAALVAAANFEENSPKLRCWLCRSIEAERGGVPEHGGPAVAEQHLVAVGEARTGRPAPCGPSRRPTARGSGDGWCRGRSRPRSAGRPPGLGRTLEGPEPKRPSAGGGWPGSGCRGCRSRMESWHSWPRDVKPHRPSSGRISARAAAVLPVGHPGRRRQGQGAQGGRVSTSIGFGAGEPDFPTPDHIVEAAVAACRDPANHHYTPTGGLPACVRPSRPRPSATRATRSPPPGAGDQRG